MSSKYSCYTYPIKVETDFILQKPVFFFSTCLLENKEKKMIKKGNKTLRVILQTSKYNNDIYTKANIEVYGIANDDIYRVNSNRITYSLDTTQNEFIQLCFETLNVYENVEIIDNMKELLCYVF